VRYSRDDKIRYRGELGVVVDEYCPSAESSFCFYVVRIGSAATLACADDMSPAPQAEKRQAVCLNRDSNGRLASFYEGEKVYVSEIDSVVTVIRQQLMHGPDGVKYWGDVDVELPSFRKRTLPVRHLQRMT
jgi:hypothetical protein